MPIRCVTCDYPCGMLSSGMCRSCLTKDSPPRHIYLHFGDGEIMWADERIDDDDIKYALAKGVNDQ